ncbi:MAG TPA: ATP-binding cassette domain-containing protein [Planctomycetota bacterium]|nr:ATP-binding cassette domain-containing protein [Planctomycetota bacterium]
MLELCGATKVYRKGSRTIRAADGLSLTVKPGDFLVIHGPSGSGKSTLLLMAGGMLPPDSGQVRFGGEDLYRWGPARRNRYRREQVGFVFQRFFLIPHITVYDNIRLRYSLRGAAAGAAEGIAALAGRLGIAERLGHYPGELSVGEQQRAAVARALAGAPGVVLADEPTGNLDPDNAAIIIDCLREEARQGRSVVMVTHNPAFIAMGTGEVHLVAGRAVEPAKGA